MFTHEMERLSSWIVHTPASKAVQGMHGYVATIQSLHILAIAAVFASAAMLNLRVLGVMNRSVPVGELALRLRQPVRIGLLVLLVTGCALLLAEPQRSLTSQVFQLKMVMLVAVCVLAVRQQRRLLDQAGASNVLGAVPISARLASIASLLLWVAIVFAGRWIAYAQY